MHGQSKPSYMRAGLVKKGKVYKQGRSHTHSCCTRGDRKGGGSMKEKMKAETKSKGMMMKLT